MPAQACLPARARGALAPGIHRRVRGPLLLVAAALLFAGCSSGTAVIRPEADVARPRVEEASPVEMPVAVEPVVPYAETATALRQQVDRWLGTPHRLGGTTADGIDCSAFVMHVFDEAFGVALPRTTAEQVRTGSPVTMDALRPGDLVFFRPTGKTRHVGVYLEAGAFAHASASRGVTVSRLQEAYWQDTYWTARRVLSEAHVAGGAAREETVLGQDERSSATTEVVAVPPPDPRTEAKRPTSSRARVGW